MMKPVSLGALNYQEQFCQHLKFARKKTVVAFQFSAVAESTVESGFLAWRSQRLMERYIFGVHGTICAVQHLLSFVDKLKCLEKMNTDAGCRCEMIRSYQLHDP